MRICLALVILHSNIQEMIHFEEAFKVVLNQAKQNASEKTNLTRAYGRILAQDVFSDVDMPPFNKSAVDGYSCRRQDIQNELEVIETVAAGYVPKKTVYENQCIKIMTGAMLPDGADCVLMVEHTEKTNENHIRFLKNDTPNNICYKAEDVNKGSKVLSKGLLVKPEHIAVLASVGCFEPKVSLKPKVAVITTGDELVEPHEIPGISQIRNSNAWQLMAQLEKTGVAAHYSGIAKDSKEDTFRKVNEALQNNDILLITGGVSMGDFDMVPEMMEKAGIDILFRTIAVQPGKPTVFGFKNNKYCFGLPGNPVATFMIFELLVKPLIYKIMGHDFIPQTIPMKFGTEYSRRASDRMSVLPVQIQPDGTIAPVDYHGSAHIHALAFAQGFVFIPIGQTKLKKGDILNVRLI